MSSASYWVCFSTCPRRKGKKRQHSLPICHRSSKIAFSDGREHRGGMQSSENVKLKKCNFFLLGPQFFLGGAAENGHNGLWSPLHLPEVGAWGLSGRWRVQLNGHPQWGRIPAPAPQGHQASEEGSGPARGSRTLALATREGGLSQDALLPAAGKGSSHGSMPQARLKLQNRLSGDPGDGRHNMQRVPLSYSFLTRCLCIQESPAARPMFLSSYLLQW